MLADFLVSLRDAHIAFNLFSYLTFRAAISFIVSFALTYYLLGLYIRRWGKRMYERISEDVPERHKVKEGTPSSGGVVFISVALLTTLLFASPVPEILAAVTATAVMGAMGLADDLSKLKRRDKKGGLPKKVKLLFQLALGLMFALVSLHIFGEKAFTTQLLFFKNYFIHMGWLYVLFVALVLAGTSNGVNLTDGLDGLAAGVVLYPLVVFGIIAYIEGNSKFAHYLNVLYIKNAGQLVVFATALAGSLVAFLWYNAHPAEIFMGDTGSQALGGALASLAILTKQEILLAIAGGVLVLETLSVALQIWYFRLTGGRRLFLMAPLHHHFEKLGWPEVKIVVRFWILSLLFSLIALSTLKIR
ncbi:MAG: phospho-N-acetylmuramoyl-pentapeptide-transferase [Thermotogae bacterium]|nr:phospho-N-acetylmuramoyl-pentapeptide-transferase [Thermotogota bacterium]